MKKAIYLLALLSLLLIIGAAVVWLSPRGHDESHRLSYGLSEGLQLVQLTDKSGASQLEVEDVAGHTVFTVMLHDCYIDTRYRNGRLRFREKATGREGYLDRKGLAIFLNGEKVETLPAGESDMTRLQAKVDAPQAKLSQPRQPKAETLPQADLKSMARNNPFYAEAAKIMQGKLDETDAKRRRVILNYCEHFRTAYTTKDIDFLRQVFSDQALIIVGHVVKEKKGGTPVSGDARVTYALHTKRDYLQRLGQVFATNKSIQVKFSDFHIMRHPTMDGIYGVTLRQRYQSDRYQDDGYLFLLWDFRTPSMPVIHVRTWQPSKTTDADDVIDISDFNLE